MGDLSGMRGGDEVKDFLVNSLMKEDMKKEKIMVLLNKVYIICCEDVLYQFDYMNLILKKKVCYDCRIDIPFASVKNCSFYLEDNIKPIDYSSLCASCKFHFVNFVSGRFHKITRDVVIGL